MFIDSKARKIVDVFEKKATNNAVAIEMIADLALGKCPSGWTSGGSYSSIDPSLGFNWKWEVKGRGDVDNKYFDNFVFKAGVKVGYTF